MSNKYEQGKIYKICDIAYSKCYYGSTTDSLCRRMCKHRYGYKRSQNGEGGIVSVYTIFDEFGVDNCKIELVELLPCASRIELGKKEGEYIKNNDCVNKMIAGRTATEWLRDNPAIAKKYNEKHKEYYAMHKDHILATIREWNKHHAEQISEHNKQYYLSHKEQIQKQKKEAFNCEVCGGRYKKADKAKHFRTALHQNAEKASSSSSGHGSSSLGD